VEKAKGTAWGGKNPAFFEHERVIVIRAEEGEMGTMKRNRRRMIDPRLGRGESPNSIVAEREEGRGPHDLDGPRRLHRGNSMVMSLLSTNEKKVLCPFLGTAEGRPPPAKNTLKTTKP